MKKIVIIFFLLLLVNMTASAFNSAEAQKFYYYNTPYDNNYYDYNDYDSYGSYSFSFPNGTYNYQYYNGTDINQMMNEINQLFSQFFSQNYQYDNGFNSQFYNFNLTPGVPNFSAPGYSLKPYNKFAPSTPDITPAPSYKDAPDIYY